MGELTYRGDLPRSTVERGEQCHNLKGLLLSGRLAAYQPPNRIFAGSSAAGLGWGLADVREFRPQASEQRVQTVLELTAPMCAAEVRDHRTN